MSATGTDLLAETRRALRHRLATGQVQGRAPSAVAAVVRDGCPVWVEGWGSVDGRPPDGDVQYRIGSITKTFVALLVLRLRDEGRLALTDPLAEHLPGTSAGQATIGALLAHTAGLRADPPGPWWERTPGDLRPELADVLGAEPQPHPAGGRHHYSNPGYALLGALVERLRGEPWGEVLRREVLDPLGMTRTALVPAAPHATGWAVHPWADVLLPEPDVDTGRMAPAGQLWSTAADLARLAVLLLDGDERVLHPDTVAEMRTPSSPPEAATLDSGYGLGTQILRRDGRLLVGHTGSLPGFLATVWVSEEDGLGAVVLGNVTAGLPVSTMAADLVATVAEREPRIPAPWRPLPVVDPDLLDLAGPWYWGPAPYLLRPVADGFLDLTGLRAVGRGTRLRPAGDGSWIGLNGYFAGERLRVVRDAAGAVSHLDLGTFVFTRRPYDPAAAVPGGVDPDGWRVPGPGAAGAQ
ncbi:serine hydrolase domain-containing protein [Jidongwangia harbinensis]|uniref:serine hydrolase domain-containing protein n=1 Tax=Jidongwangia harbinensis TaxID=2878561 RepID=UPI001CD9C6DE|nr:serine hydrolase domain-containing protein [Jidongwangia harbinensis]MCA2216369.1 beta-lactamase family protein [Jidongwangia harbinensis]MCA2217104.1 beta-lactamase family protein [Jidongwangia harbinensis]